MTNQIAITVSKQGTEDATAKTQDKGGSKGFLGMLMTAIGHQRKVKPAKDAHAPATNISAKNTTKNRAPETGAADKRTAACKAEASKSKSSNLATKLAMPGDSLTTDSGKLQAIAGDGHESVAGSPAPNSSIAAGSGKDRNTSNAGTAKQHATNKDARHRSDSETKTKDQTGTEVAETVVAAVSQDSPPTAPLVRPASNKNASMKKGAKQHSDPHLHPIRLAGTPTPAAIHIQRQSITDEHIPEKAAATHQAANTSRPPTGQGHTTKGSPPNTAAGAGLAAANTPSLAENGRIAPLTHQDADTNTASTAGEGSIAANTASAASSQNGTTAGASKTEVAETISSSGIPAGSSMATPDPRPAHQQSDGSRTSSVAVPSHAADSGLPRSTHASGGGTTPMAHADGTVMAVREAAEVSMPHSMDGGKAHTKHTTSTDTHAHADNEHPSDIPTAGAKASREGIRFYGRLVADAHRASMPSKVTSKISKSVHGIHAGPPPTASGLPAGQNATTGNMPLASAANPGTQVAANAHTPPPPIQTSGPWTAMAAMQEIGQAALNGHSSLELKLEPAHLGKVHVRIDSDASKNIRVHLVVEQAASRQAIEQQLPNLRHALEQQGLNLGNFSMSSQQQGAGNGYAPDQRAQQSTPMPMGTPSETITPPLVNSANVYPGSGRLSIRI